MTWTPFKKGMVTFATFYAFLSLAFNMTGNNVLNLYRLSSSGISTRSTVTAIHPDDHRACDFEYSVDGRRYSHQESCDFEVGEVSNLIYLATNPTVAIVRSPEEELKTSIFVPPIASIVFGLFAAASAWFEARRLANRVD